MPSASRRPKLRRRPLARAATLALCLVLIGAAFAGCETTQEKAAKQQARAAHILRERAKRQKQKKAQKARAESRKHDREGKK